MFALSFLVDVNHPVFAKEMYLLGKKYIEVDKIRSFISLYFSRVANFKGYGLKFATEYLKNKLPIDDNCRNMLIALDEPELLEYLLKYEKTDENWASVMVRLTRKTFGSLGKDLNINNWKKYIEEVLPD